MEHEAGSSWSTCVNPRAHRGLTYLTMTCHNVRTAVCCMSSHQYWCFSSPNPLLARSPLVRSLVPTFPHERHRLATNQYDLCNAGRAARGARCGNRGGGGVAVGLAHQRRDSEGHASRGDADACERRGCQGTVNTYRGRPTRTVVVATLDFREFFFSLAPHGRSPPLCNALLRARCLLVILRPSRSCEECSTPTRSITKTVLETFKSESATPRSKNSPRSDQET